ncbi:MAG: transglycosylase domain-containing protein [Bacteroidales bacterium]|nr:transglycosylase domain-containing protein [Bacteroidales bacterium]
MILKQLRWKKVFSFTFGTLVFLFIVLLFIKNSIFQYIVRTKVEEFNKEHISQIHVEDFILKGFNTVSFKNFTIIQNSDTTINIDTISIHFSFWKALIGDISIKKIYANNLLFNFTFSDTSDSFSLLLRKKHIEFNDTIQQPDEPNIKKKAHFLFHMLFNLLPEEGNILNTFICITRQNNNKINIQIPFIAIKNYLLKTPIFINDNKNKQSIKAACAINKETQFLTVKCIQEYKKNEYFPGFSDIQLKFHFDTAFFNIKCTTINDILSLTGQGNLTNFVLHQPSLSTSEVVFNTISSNFKIYIDNHFALLDSSTSISLGLLNFHPYIKYTTSPEKEIEIKINEPAIDAQNFFSSLPEGLFPNTNNIKAKGTLSYKLHFQLNFNRIDSLVLISELQPHKFKIISYGKLNLAQIDSDFIHTVYEKGEPVETIFISYSNPNYIPLSRISPYLRNALLCTEDGGFYWHRGFLPDAFREAMIENIKRKRFARGGSTITMQLVKNLYLNRYKVISRKLEEMLIVWLIENLRLASKDRLFEIYLNIIEFGPGIYGIAKGTSFYFNKLPHELTLPEAIFLASIVPKPKRFAASFDSTGTLKPDVQDFMNFVAKKMYEKQMISEQEWNQFEPHITLKGKAKDFISSPSNN